MLLVHPVRPRDNQGSRGRDAVLLTPAGLAVGDYALPAWAMVLHGLQTEVQGCSGMVCDEPSIACIALC